VYVPFSKKLIRDQPIANIPATPKDSPKFSLPPLQTSDFPAKISQNSLSWDKLTFANQEPQELTYIDTYTTAWGIEKSQSFRNKFFEFSVKIQNPIHCIASVINAPYWPYSYDLRFEFFSDRQKLLQQVLRGKIEIQYTQGWQ
jgi:hypothetical protein